MADIAALLSQHQLLRSLCSNLSAADIIHLSATCKENRMHVVSSQPILDKLLSDAICDGRGIVAQAAVFGDWGGNPSKAPYRCLEADARPCSACGINVCNNCRFHFYYGSVFEREMVEQKEGESIDGGLRPTGSIPFKRAFEMFWQKRRQTFCEECHPLIMPGANRHQRCRCELYDHYVDQRWLCLPCFFVEETGAYQVKGERVCGYMPRFLSAQPGYSIGYLTEDLCDCGKPASETTEACRICNQATAWDPNFLNGVVLPKIQEQLG